MCEENNCACATKPAANQGHEHGNNCACKNGGECKCGGACERPKDIQAALGKSMDCVCKDGVCECKPKEQTAEEA